MFYLKVLSGDIEGETLSVHDSINEALEELQETIEADAEDVMRHGIPKLNGTYSPTYAEALEYARGFFYIEEERGNG